MIGTTQRPIRYKALRGIFRLQPRVHLRDAFITHLSEQPRGTGGDEGILVGKQRSHRRHCLSTSGFQAGEAAVAHVVRRALQGLDLTFDGVQIEFGHHALETLRRDAVDGSGVAVVTRAVTADTGIKPIGYIQCAIGSDADIAGAEFGLQLARWTPAEEVAACPFLLFVGGEEVHALQLEARAISFRQIAENDILARFAREQQTAPLFTERSVFIKGHAGGRSTAIDIARGHRAGVFLTPLRRRCVLAGALVRTPTAFAIGAGESGIAALQHMTHAAGWRVIIVALEKIAEAGERLLVAVAVVVPDDVHVRAIGIHAHAEAADPHMAVIALQARDVLQHVGAAHAEGFAAAVGELGTGVALIEIPLPIRSGDEAVQTVIMLAACKTGEQSLPLVRNAVAIGVGVNEQVRRLRDDDLVIEHGDTKWCGEFFLLHEHAALVGFAIVVSVFEDDNAISLRAAATFAAIVHAFRNIHPTLRIEVDVRRIVEHRRGGPHSDFQAFRHAEHLRWHQWRPGIQIALLQLRRQRGVDVKAHRRIARFASADHAAVIDRHLRGEALDTGGQIIRDGR